ncbi:MAG: formate dehydrogenase accessory sulfurtransferase FdhD [Acidobacteriota bacterium]
MVLRSRPGQSPRRPDALRAKTPARVERFGGGDRSEVDDLLATEEPLEIRVAAGRGAGREEHTVAVTMRTPGHDDELAVGFLFAEGVIARRDDVAAVGPVIDEPLPDLPDGCSNVVLVELAADRLPEMARLERHFFTTSACGVCGKSGIENLTLRAAPLPDGPQISAQVLAGLPATLRESQGVFDATGGLHAAAFFDLKGNLLSVREDVGRHNALDKLIGRAFLAGELPFENGAVLVSGRSSFEILQKCLAARAPIVAAVSAPSSLAVQVARGFHLTLAGFVRGDRFNLYSGFERVV